MLKELVAWFTGVLILAGVSLIANGWLALVIYNKNGEIQTLKSCVKTRANYCEILVGKPAK